MTTAAVAQQVEPWIASVGSGVRVPAAASINTEFMDGGPVNHCPLGTWFDSTAIHHRVSSERSPRSCAPGRVVRGSFWRGSDTHAHMFGATQTWRHP